MARPLTVAISDDALARAVNVALAEGVTREQMPARLARQFGAKMGWSGIKKRLQRAGYHFAPTGWWEKERKNNERTSP